MLCEIFHRKSLDLAAADSSATSVVVVRLGNGDGTFQPQTTLSIPEGAGSIVVDDLNIDNNLDIITGRGSILLGNGDGTFQPASSFPVGAAPNRVRTGDLNGDSKPDVVVTSGGSHIVSVLLGNGDGTLQTPRHYVTGNTPTEVSIVDLDGDGVIDLLVSNVNDDHLSLLYGNGNGTFKGLPTYPTVANLSNRLGAFDAAVADFTGDTVPDVVVANGSINSSTAALLPGLGAGALDAARTIPGLDGSRVVAGDWNGDTNQDLAFTSGDPPRLSVALGNGDGTFDAPTNFMLSGTKTHSRIFSPRPW